MLVLACDGITDVFPDNNDLAKTLYSLLKSAKEPKTIVSKVIGIAHDRKSRDNMTMVFLKFD